MARALFIYGTLKQGFHNFDPERSGDARPGIFKTVQRYPLHITGPWGAPVMINEPCKGNHVIGEIHDVTIEQLLWFDEFEGTHLAHGYDRISIHLSNGTGELVDADVYTKPRRRIDAIIGEPLEVYPRDSRYVPPSERE